MNEQTSEFWMKRKSATKNKMEKKTGIYWNGIEKNVIGIHAVQINNYSIGEDVQSTMHIEKCSRSIEFNKSISCVALHKRVAHEQVHLVFDHWFWMASNWKLNWLDKAMDLRFHYS